MHHVLYPEVLKKLFKLLQHIYKYMKAISSCLATWKLNCGKRNSVLFLYCISDFIILNTSIGLAHQFGMHLKTRNQVKITYFLHRYSEYISIKHHWMNRQGNHFHYQNIFFLTLLRQVFIRVDRLEIRPVIVVFSTQLCELLLL